MNARSRCLAIFLRIFVVKGALTLKQPAFRGAGTPRWGALALHWGLCLLTTSAAQAAPSLERARDAFHSGDYAQCRAWANQAIDQASRYPEDWGVLLAKVLKRVGRYDEGRKVMGAGVQRRPESLRLRWWASRFLTWTGHPDEAEGQLRSIYNWYRRRPGWYESGPDLVALGRTLLELGGDPRTVLENLYQRAKESDPEYPGVYRAAGTLALAKHDYELAAEWFQQGIEHFPESPEMAYGRGRAYRPSDRRRMLKSLAEALELNPRHTSSLLLKADHLIDSESYTAASDLLEKVLEVNPDSPKAWAYRAVMAHLEGEPEREAQCRKEALKVWANNPEVEHLMGRKLSQKYRFREGARYQERALEKDPDYIQAKIQLAQDRMRLGEDEQGWRLAKEVYEADSYNVRAYNLLTLKDKLDQFTVLTNSRFVVRMDPEEARLYGDRVMELLGEARAKLTGKYDVELEQRTRVEIFPEQKDFGVRTFGMPDNPGYLGVCFGDVVTMNSPASQSGRPVNWEAVAWHEFCHVVTLNRSQNKMPRWLSEGISVYEENQAAKGWGRAMTPEYREIILEGGLTPIQDLSAAFLAPQSGRHLQFAYYEASLVVEFLVERFGINALKQVLSDLGDGKEVYASLADRTLPMERLEAEFADYAKAKASRLASELSWEKPEEGVIPTDKLAGQANYWRLQRRAAASIEKQEWEKAKAPLRTLIKHFPEQTGEANAYRQLARVHRELGETAEEYTTLQELARRDGEALEAYARLMELGADRGDWDDVARNAARYLAVYPLRALPFRYLARSREHLDEPSKAIEAYRKLVELGPSDPAEVHFRMARLMRQIGQDGVKRELLKTLEHAPRFREAHKLLLQHIEADKPSPPAGDKGNVRGVEQDEVPSDSVEAQP